MRRLCIIACSIALMGLATGAFTGAFAQMPPSKIGDSAKGKVLTDQKGMTLYTFDQDSKGKSACNDGCSQIWPPFAAAAGAKPADAYSIITRSDGSRQWAYKDKPLYTFLNDHQPGDITGDGFANNAWHIAKP